MPLNSPAEHIPGFEYRATEALCCRVPALDGFGRMVAIRKQRWLKGRKTVSVRFLTFGVVTPSKGLALGFGWGLF